MSYHRLRLADLGYFNLGAFEELDRGGAYYISRYKVGTKLFDKDGSGLDLAALGVFGSGYSGLDGVYIPVGCKANGSEGSQGSGYTEETKA